MKQKIYALILIIGLSMVSFISLRAETVTLMMTTSLGEVTLELYPEKAPITVQNFLKYVDENRYDGGTFYRVVRMDNQQQNNIKIEVIQGGLGMAAADPAFPAIAHETTKDSGILHKDGVISMARLAPGTATSEFFICINDQPDLDHGGMRNPDGLGFATFGKVIKGMDIVRKIQMVKTDSPAGGELEYTSGQMVSDPVIIQHLSRQIQPKSAQY